MDPRYNTANLTTGVLALLTLWLAVGRFRLPMESNWPLVYYGLLLAYLEFHPQQLLNPYLVYVAVISALFLRFEFMGGLFLKIARTVEFLALALVGWQLAAHLLL